MLADALFPIFGKAIRKAITSELDGMLQSLSQTLEQSFSWRSLQWRWESFSTGKPYAEIVVLRSLLYRVEQVFLIHRSSGLLLQHVAAPSVAAAETKDPEMVSGMLTAIQDFVRDSVSGAGSETLETIRMGEIEVVLAYGPDAILAGFVRGVAPRKLSRVFQDALDAIEQKKAEALHTFSGDTSRFDSCRPQLEACLLGQGKPDQRCIHFLGCARAPVRTAGPVGVGPGRVVDLFGRHRAPLDRFRASLGKRTRHRAHSHRKARLEILHLGTARSAGSRSRIALAGRLVSSNVEFHWEEYHSLVPRFAAQRRLAELKDELEKRAFRFMTAQRRDPA